MNRDKIPWVVIYVVILSGALDTVFTLLGQPFAYWSDHALVCEGAPHIRFLLKQDPLYYIAGAIVFWIFLVFCMRNLPLLLGMMLSVFLLVAHVSASSSWVVRFLREPSLAYSAFQYYSQFVYIGAICCLVAFVIYLVLTGHVAPKAGRRVVLVLSLAFFVLASGSALFTRIRLYNSEKEALLRLRDESSDKRIFEALKVLQNEIVPADKLLSIVQSNRVWYVRTSAIRHVVKHIKEPDVVETLVDLMQDRNIAVRQAVMSNLYLVNRADISDEMKIVVRTYCEDSDPEVAFWTNSILWKIGEKDALQRLLQLLSRTTYTIHRSMIGRTVKQLDGSIDINEFFERDGEALSRKWLTWYESHEGEIYWSSEKARFVMQVVQQHNEH